MKTDKNLWWFRMSSYRDHQDHTAFWIEKLDQNLSFQKGIKNIVKTNSPKNSWDHFIYFPPLLITSGEWGHFYLLPVYCSFTNRYSTLSTQWGGPWQWNGLTLTCQVVLAENVKRQRYFRCDISKLEKQLQVALSQFGILSLLTELGHGKPWSSFFTDAKFAGRMGKLAGPGFQKSRNCFVRAHILHSKNLGDDFAASGMSWDTPWHSLGWCPILGRNNNALQFLQDGAAGVPMDGECPQNFIL